jgi:excisionase family DNA binding protein
MDQLRIRPVYPVDELCEDFGLSRTTVYAEILAGRLKAFKIGRKTMVAGEDALAWRDRHREAGFSKAPYPSSRRRRTPAAA